MASYATGQLHNWNNDIVQDSTCTYKVVFLNKKQHTVSFAKNYWISCYFKTSVQSEKLPLECTLKDSSHKTTYIYIFFNQWKLCLCFLHVFDTFLFPVWAKAPSHSWWEHISIGCSPESACDDWLAHALVADNWPLTCCMFHPLPGVGTKKWNNSVEEEEEEERSYKVCAYIWLHTYKFMWLPGLCWLVITQEFGAMGANGHS